MKRLIIAVVTAVTLLCLLAGALARTNPGLFFASNSASGESQDSAAYRLLRRFSAASTNPTTPQQASRSVMLRGARVSVAEDNRLVISMDASGDLKGLMSVWIERGADGASVVSGDWSLVVAYTRDEPGGDGHEAGEGHSEHEVFVNEGTIGGKISGGALTLNPDGSVASVDSLQLTLLSGSLTFAGANGNGSAQLSGLQDYAGSTGTMVLSY